MRPNRKFLPVVGVSLACPGDDGDGLRVVADVRGPQPDRAVARLGIGVIDLRDMARLDAPLGAACTACWPMDGNVFRSSDVAGRLVSKPGGGGLVVMGQCY